MDFQGGKALLLDLGLQAQDEDSSSSCGVPLLGRASHPQHAQLHIPQPDLPVLRVCSPFPGGVPGAQRQLGAGERGVMTKFSECEGRAFSGLGAPRERKQRFSVPGSAIFIGQQEHKRAKSHNFVVH